MNTTDYWLKEINETDCGFKEMNDNVPIVEVSLSDDVMIWYKKRWIWSNMYGVR